MTFPLVVWELKAVTVKVLVLGTLVTACEFKSLAAPEVKLSVTKSPTTNLWSAYVTVTVVPDWLYVPKAVAKIEL